MVLAQNIPSVIGKASTEGITLVALVITIIVLVILAAVSINAVQQGGIIQKAKDARDAYTTAAELEDKEISKASIKIASRAAEKDFIPKNTPYKLKNTYLTGVSIGEYTGANGFVTETIQSFQSKLPDGYKIYGINEEELSVDAYVSTGMIVKNSKGQIIGRVVVFGDVAEAEASVGKIGNSDYLDLTRRINSKVIRLPAR